MKRLIDTKLLLVCIICQNVSSMNKQKQKPWEGFMKHQVREARHDIKMIAIGEEIARNRRDALNARARAVYATENEFMLNMQRVDAMMANFWSTAASNEDAPFFMHSYCCWKAISDVSILFHKKFKESENPITSALMDDFHKFMSQFVCQTGISANFEWSETKNPIRQGLMNDVIDSSWTPKTVKAEAAKWLETDLADHEQHRDYFQVLHIVEWFDLSDTQMNNFKLKPHERHFNCADQDWSYQDELKNAFISYEGGKDKLAVRQQQAWPDFEQKINEVFPA